MHRRSFLKAAAGLAVVACGPPPSPGGPRAFSLADGLEDAVENPAVFPYGVQAGGAEPTSVMVWSQTPVLDEVELWVWRADGEVLVRQDVAPDAHGHLRVTLDDLDSGSDHFYAFVSSDGLVRSTAGRFVTAFADDELRPMTIAAATCTHWRLQPWRALERTALEDFDLLLHLGDMAYNDSARTPAEYRTSWRRALLDPGYRALLPRASTLHAWDDHEFWNNPDPEIDPERLAIARAAFFESLPQRHGPEGRLWRSYRWGLTAEVLVLDARTERKPSTRLTDGIFLSPEQMSFVDDTLRNSPCRFKLLMNSVPVTRMPGAWPSDDDRWQGYDHQRAQLLEILEDDAAARGTVFVSGDTHVGFVAHVEPDGVHHRLLEVAVGPSGNINPWGWEAVRGLTLPDSQFEFAGDRLAATTFRLDPESGEMRVRFIDSETGDVTHDHVYRPGT